MVPRIFGPYEPLRRDYPIEDYLADAVPAGIDAAVYVQPNWPLERAVEEVVWIAGVQAAAGWPQAVIAAADMFDPGAPAVFARQRAASPLVRGIRLQLHWHADERYRYATAPDRTGEAAFRSNLAALAELGWLFELQVFPSQMAAAAEAVAATPALTFVLVHAGMLESGAAEHVRPWREGLTRLAALPNVVVKLSGQGTFVRRLDTDLIRLATHTAVELFGSERCMFGSNFPIEGLWTDMASLIGAWVAVVGELDLEQRRDILGRTARRVYDLG